jgi:zinc/manganese transport system permease protein
MFAHDFVRNAYLAGTFVALACGTIGWLVVARAQVFAADALSHVAFVGAIAAALIGVAEPVGLIVATLAVGAAMAALGRRGTADDTSIGIVFAWILGIGILLITVLARSSAGGTGIAATNALFGSIFSLSRGDATLAAVIAATVAALVVLGFRPFLLASLEAELARARGIRVRALGVLFFILLALITAESTQAVGAMLLLGLIAAPAGAAHRLTTRPYAGIAISAAIAVAAMWAGLALSYQIPSLPPSSAIIGLAAAAYGAAALAPRLTRGISIRMNRATSTARH